MESDVIYTVYITPKDCAENYSLYFHHNHYISERFKAEHGVKVMDLKQFKFYQAKSNLTGEIAMEVQISSKFTEPIKGKIWDASKARDQV